MVVNQKVTGKASSMPAGLAFGALCSVMSTMIFAGILAKLIEKETIPESSIGYGVMILLILSSFLGAMMAFGKIKRQRVVVCGASGAIYFGILLSITAMFFGGQYSAVGETALLVVCGSGLAALLGLQEGRGGKKPKIKIPHR